MGEFSTPEQCGRCKLAVEVTRTANVTHDTLTILASEIDNLRQVASALDENAPPTFDKISLRVSAADQTSGQLEDMVDHEAAARDHRLITEKCPGKLPADGVVETLLEFLHVQRPKCGLAQQVTGSPMVPLYRETILGPLRESDS